MALQQFSSTDEKGGPYGKVWPYLRVVPNGFVKGADGVPDRRRLRATVTFTPLPNDDPQSLHLSSWPLDIATSLTKGGSVLSELQIEVAELRKTGAAFDLSVAEPVANVSEAKDGYLRTMAEAGTQLHDIWATSFYPNGSKTGATAAENLWNGLCGMIAETVRGRRTVPGAICGETERPVLNIENLGNQGQYLDSPGTRRRTVHSVIGIPHSDAALSLEMQRAKELSHSIADRGIEAERELPEMTDPIDTTIAKLPEDTFARGQKRRAYDFPKEIKDFLSQAPGPPAFVRTGSETTADAIRNWDHAFFSKFPGNTAGIDDSAFLNWRKDKGEALAAARRVMTDEAIRLRKMQRFTALDSLLEEDRNAAEATYRAVMDSLSEDKLVDRCTYNGLTSAEVVSNAKMSLDKSWTRSEYGLWPQHENEAGQPASTREPAPPDDHRNEPSPDLKRAAQAYFTVEGSPGQARVFGLAIDVIIDLPVGAETWPFAAFSARLGDVEISAPVPWSLAKIAGYDDQTAGIGWPATRDEYLSWRKGSPVKLPAHCIGQYGGVLVMGGVPAKEGRLPRYDISTLDVATALEAEKNWLDSVKEKRALLESDSTNSTLKRELQRLISIGPDYQSNGLTLLCRSAVSDAIRKLAAMQAKLRQDGCCVGEDCNGRPAVVMDAEDLTSGFRTFVGTQSNRTTTRWRTLMGRWFRYGNRDDTRPSDGLLVERLLTLALSSAGSPERIALESALTAIPSRDVRLLGSDGDDIEAIVEETVTQWDGTPGGVACAAIPEDDEGVADVMTYSRRSYIPESGTRPPNLRYGRPYRFALQAVYAGGWAIDLADVNATDRPLEITSVPPDDARQRLFYPSLGLANQGSGNTRPAIRALRHARIGAPALLLPAGAATERLGPMGFESAGKMIVRTLLPVDGANTGRRDATRATPSISQRLLVIPHMPLATAARHLTGTTPADRGVLDRFNSDGQGPPGGLSRAVYKPGRDGFPAVKATYRYGFDGAPYVDRREIEPSRVTRNDWETESSVFQTDTTERQTDYYPDPAADTLVLRARRVAGPDGQRDLLPGKPIQIELSNGLEYPDRLPVLLTLKKDVTRNGSFRQEEVIVTGQVGNINPERYSDVRHRSGLLPAQSVEIHLNPGEQIELEAWIVPSAERLGHDFAVLQGFLQFLCANGGAANGDCNRASLRTGINAVFGKETETAEALKAVVERAADSIRFIGPGGDILPGTGIVRAIATELRARMLRHPLPEISAIRTLTAVHAVNVPQDARPKALAKPLDTGVLAPLPVPGEANSDPEPLRAIRPMAGATEVPEPGSLDTIAKGARTLALSGSVVMDLTKMDTLEITALTQSPERTVFDDPERGRSLAHRMAGTWPGKLENPQEPRDPLNVFGFRVAPDGRVALPEGQVTLIRLEALPLPSSEDNFFAVDLAPYFMRLGDVAERTVSQRHQFPDGKARRLFLTLNGLARTAEYMTTAARVANRGDPWLEDSGLVYERGELIPAERLSTSLQRNTHGPEPLEVVLPATIRPAMVEAKAPVPAFETALPEITRSRSDVTMTYTRQAVVRLRLRRGWFSSGVDERLGIVVWPPDQILSDHALLSRNRVRLRPRLECHATPKAPRDIMLSEFLDEDLGPGGSFVTRRASDPVRMGKRASEFGEREIFLSKEAFADLWRHPLDPAKAEFVPHALMPLADMETTEVNNEDKTANMSKQIDTTPPMAVGLITYEPRFDVEREEWYVDVLIEPGRSADSFVRFGLVRYQPHTRPDLQCSKPVAQWAQPLPERRITITATPGQLKVRIEGPVSVGRAEEMTPANCSAEGAKSFETLFHSLERPHMRLTAFRDLQTPAGGGGRVPSTIFGPSASEEVRADIIDGRGVWSVTINTSSFTADDWQTKLSVEEIEYFLPADFGENEPVPRNQFCQMDKNEWREHGARFAAILNLSQLAPEGA